MGACAIVVIVNELSIIIIFLCNYAMFCDLKSCKVAGPVGEGFFSNP